METRGNPALFTRMSAVLIVLGTFPGRADICTVRNVDLSGNGAASTFINGLRGSLDIF